MANVHLAGVERAAAIVMAALAVTASGRAWPRAPATALLQGYVDLSQFPVSDLGGVEFHNVGDMPAEFAHTGGGCGALYLWTREE